MLSEEERKWFRKNMKELWECYIQGNSSEEFKRKLLNSYFKQSEEIRRDIRNFMRKAWEKGEDGNWQEDAVAALQLIGIECKIVSKKKRR